MYMDIDPPLKNHRGTKSKAKSGGNKLKQTARHINRGNHKENQQHLQQAHINHIPFR